MKRIVVFVLFLVFYSCSADKKEEKIKEKIKIEKSFENNVMNFDKYFDSFEKIQIKNEVLGKIWRILVKDEKIFILTKSGKNRVYIYDRNKDTLIKIGKLGKGPNEFVSIRDFYIFNNKINVLDFSKKRILKFDFNGKFVNLIEFPIYCDRVLQLDNNNYVLFKKVKYKNSSEYKVNLYSEEKNKIVNEYLDLENIDEMRDFTQNTTLYYYNDTIRLFQTFSDKIFDIFKDKIKVKYLFDFGKYSLPNEIYNDSKLDLFKFVSKCRASSFVWAKNTFFENERYSEFLFKYNNNNYLNLYDKYKDKSSSYQYFSDNLFSNIQKGSFSLGFRPVFMNNNSFYFIIEPYYLIKQTSKHVKNVSINDNPIIVKYNFKK